MKQGRAPTKSGPIKREPISKAVSPGAVSQIGCKVGEARAVKSLDIGRGYKAPAIGGGTHRSGSQGKH
jgi:hypothetical protein